MRTNFGTACTGRCTRKGHAASVRLLRRQRLRYRHRPLRKEGHSCARGHSMREAQPVPTPQRLGSPSGRAGTAEGRD